MAESTTQTQRQTTRETAGVKAAATRKKNATKRSTAAKKAAATRSANQGAAARSTTTRKAKATATRGRTNAAKAAAAAKSEIQTPLARATDIAEKVVLVPVGAALVARDEVVATFEDLRSSYASTTKAKQELRRFERRGSSAVKLAGARIENVYATGRTAATKATTSVQERIAARI